MFKSIVSRGTLAALFAAALISIAPSSAFAQSEELIAAAKKEGRVVWYTTIIIDQAVRPIAAAFEKKYGIKVEFSRAGSAETALKIINEGRAGKVMGDVFDGTATFSSIMPAGLVAPYKPVNAAPYQKEFKDPDGHWTAVVMYYLSVGVNTKLVSDADAPKTYEDLLNPKWKDKMVWAVVGEPSGAPGFIGNILLTMGEEKGMDYLKKLAKQNITNMTTSQRTVLDRVILGDFPLGLMIFNHHTVISAKQGAPTRILNVEPFVGAASLVGLLKGGPNPNAGKLLIEYVLSKEGQEVLKKADYIPAHPDVDGSDPSLKPEGGKFKANFLMPNVVDANMKRWTEILNDLFR